MLNLSQPKNLVNNPSGVSLLDILETSEHQFLTLYCAQCGYQYSFYARCGDRTCPECRYRDYLRFVSLYKPIVLSKVNLRLMTLTLRGRVGFLPHSRVVRLRRCFKRLLHQQYYSKRLKGGFYTIEAVNKGRGWNIHIHVLYEGLFIPQSRLKRDWFKLTRDSLVVDIRKVWSPVGSLKYILKYLSKPPKVKGFEDEYNDAFRGTRFVSSFGTWYKQAVEVEKKEFICPNCGSRVWLSEFALRQLTRWVNTS